VLLLRSAVLIWCVVFGSVELALCQVGTSVNKITGSSDKDGDMRGSGALSTASAVAIARPIHACYVPVAESDRVSTQSPNANVELTGAHAYLIYEDGRTLVYVVKGAAKLSGKSGLKQSVTLAANEVGTVENDGSARVAQFYGPACPPRLVNAQNIVGAGGVAGTAGLATGVLLQHPASPSK
jgi:hypothetical protein